MHHRAAAAGLVVAMAATIAACGDGGADTGEADRPQSDIVVVAEDTRFAPSAFAIEAGYEVTLMLENRDAIEHDLEVAGLDAEVIAGGLAPPGDHGGGHEAAGGVGGHVRVLLHDSGSQGCGHERHAHRPLT